MKLLVSEQSHSPHILYKKPALTVSPLFFFPGFAYSFVQTEGVRKGNVASQGCLFLQLVLRRKRKEHEKEKDKKKHGNRNEYKKEAKEETLNK